jgi:F0F1-type ATP synthase assembly protein I
VAQQLTPELRQQKSGDALAAAFELVATPALFAFFGWKIDGWLGTSPVFILILTIFTASYSIYRLLAQYDREMAAHAQARNSREDANMTGPPA